MKSTTFVLLLAALPLGCGGSRQADATLTQDELQPKTCTVDYWIRNQWNGGYTADIVFQSDSPLDAWKLAWTFPGATTVSSFWNGILRQSGLQATVANASYNGHVVANTSVTLGLVANVQGAATKPTAFTLNGTTCTVAGAAAPDGGADAGSDAAAPGDGGSDASTPDQGSTTDAGAPVDGGATDAGGSTTGTTPLARHGSLHVCGTHLCDASNAVGQLRGISTPGLQWFGWGSRCLNGSALDAMAGTWKADVVRLAMYVQEGGYTTDPAGYRTMIDTLVDETGKRGLYAIIDWHILTPGDPNANLAAAQDFFRYMADKHGNDPHVLFEIGNEPNGVPWSSIQSYAQQILPIIRAEKGSSTVVIVGTPDWSSFGMSGGRNPDDIVQNPPRDPSNTPYDNLMYTFHFYAASHGAGYRNLVQTYADKVPIFVTEWGTPTASGDGPLDEDSTAAWLSLMNDKKLSWTYWNWSDNGQSGALFATGACGSPWTGASLQRAGQIVYSALTSP